MDYQTVGPTQAIALVKMEEIFEQMVSCLLKNESLSISLASPTRCRSDGQSPQGRFLFLVLFHFIDDDSRLVERFRAFNFGAKVYFMSAPETRGEEDTGVERSCMTRGNHVWDNVVFFESVFSSGEWVRWCHD